MREQPPRLAGQAKTEFDPTPFPPEPQDNADSLIAMHHSDTETQRKAKERKSRSSAALGLCVSVVMDLRPYVGKLRPTNPFSRHHHASRHSLYSQQRCLRKKVASGDDGSGVRFH